MLAHGRQKPAYAHFVARIFSKILAEQASHFIDKRLWLTKTRNEGWIFAPAGVSAIPEHTPSRACSYHYI